MAKAKSKQLVIADIEIGNFYQIKWRRASLFPDQPGKTDSVKCKVTADDLKTNDGSVCYEAYDKTGRRVPIRKDAIIEAKPIKEFKLPKGVVPTNKGRVFKDDKQAT